MTTPATMIEVRALEHTVQTGDRPLTILADIDLSVAAGDSLAIVGVSGSGKSTLLGLLAGLDSPTGGSIHLAGHELTALDEDRRAEVRGRHVGFVFQSFQLLPNLTARENVMLPLEIAGGERIAERASDILERVGLGHRMDHYPRQLSGGEQQRVALARAFITGPEILFADEPTGNLDSRTGEQIIELLFELNRERNTTLVLVTHDLKLAERCAHCITLDAGRIQARPDAA